MKWLKFSGMLVSVMAISLGFVPQAGASTDNFTINSFDVQMTLGRDGSQYSTLRTVETVTADFPTSDENHGLEQDFVKEYDNHQTHFSLVSVTDENGASLPYHWEGDALRIGSADAYVHGLQTYKITYTQRDVTKYYSDTNRDEFYWDAIGTEWRVPIDSAHISITLDNGLASMTKSSPYCYQGANGSTGQCQLTAAGDTYTMAADSIGAGQGVTVAFGFAPKTFAVYQQTFGEKISTLIVFSNMIISPIVLVVGLVLLMLRRRRAKNSHAAIEKGTVVPQYLPPSDYSVMQSSQIYLGSVQGRGLSAQLIDWAVRHYIEVRETKQKSFFGGAAQYTIVVKKSFDDLSDTEQSCARTLFGGLPTVGSSLTTKELQKRSQVLTVQLTALSKVIKKSDLYEKNSAASTWFGRTALLFLVLGVLMVSVPIIVLSIIAVCFKYSGSYHSEAGARLKNYLDGLKMYIGVAEEDRLKMLQSPDGAEKIGDVASDEGALLKLYERVLPYAVLFGQEKEWNNRLGKLYEQQGTQPNWYVGQSVFNAVALSSMVSGFLSSVASASSYSSSSGGSGGGGFSGGGGGGGGGGGW